MGRDRDLRGYYTDNNKKPTVEKANNKMVDEPTDSDTNAIDDTGNNANGETIASISGQNAGNETNQLANDRDNGNSDKLPDIAAYMQTARFALNSVDDIVMKGYLEELSTMEVARYEDEDSKDNIILFKVDLMAYEKDEYATDKFVSAFSAMTYASDSIFLIVDGFEDHTDFYIGVKNHSQYQISTIAATLESSLKGQFPGIKLSNMSMIEAGKNHSRQQKLIREMREANSVSSSIGIPAPKGENPYDNTNYIQGIEKFADAMQGKRYTAVILAQNQMPASIDRIRSAYENLYTQLSCMASQQLGYTTNESLAHAVTRSQGTTDTIGHTVSEGKTKTISFSVSESQGTSKSRSTGTSQGESKQNIWGKGAGLSSPIMVAGAALTFSGIGAPVGAAVMGLGGLLGIGGMIGSKTKNQNTQVNEQESENRQKTVNNGSQDGQSHSESDSTTHAEMLTDSEGNTSTIGNSKNFTLKLHNKKVEEILKRIDKQLERIDSAEGTGMWSACAYFLSYDDDKSTSQTGASIFRSIMQGDESGVETSAINTWYTNADARTSLLIDSAKREEYIEKNGVSMPEINGAKMLASVTTFNHPVYGYYSKLSDDYRMKVEVEGTSLITSYELAILMGLPRKSVPGLPVIDHISLGKEVVRLNGKAGDGSIDVGVIFDQGVEHQHNKVRLNAKSLTQHVFVTGSTGSGKSETVYRMLEQAKNVGATYLVIEPAKGEYKRVFGDANVFGTNPRLNQLIRINPFRFPEGIHVLEHIDRLVEIFNVCWPMYAAMPAVLKKAVIRSYEKCGWSLYESVNKYSTPVFPSFIDLLHELETAINESAYSDEVKGNYIGSLVTRVESLTNGINGEIFSADEVSEVMLFDQNTIVDLSRIGSQETKSLVMGILIMRLNEYRMVNAQSANAGLRHLTVLEEAHNILQRTTTEQSMEGSNVTGKSVEMLINSIAEMRTYGEGFVIVDQSPTSVHAAAIKNTNTKVIMRLPDGDDREISGKSAALKPEQIDEIAKLPTGVAIVYQNDWVQPVMSKITMMEEERIEAPVAKDEKQHIKSELPIVEILNLLLKGRLSTSVEPNLEAIANGLANATIPMSYKALLQEYVDEYRENGKLTIWENDNFPKLSKIITDLLGVGNRVAALALSASTFEELNLLLTDLVNSIADVPPYMDLTIKQTLMRDYAEAGLSQLKIYNSWLQETKKSLL